MRLSLLRAVNVVTDRERGRETQKTQALKQPFEGKIGHIQKIKFIFVAPAREEGLLD